MLILNLFREVKADKFRKIEPYEIKTWTQLLEQLIRIVSEHNDLDPKKVPNATEEANNN